MKANFTHSLKCTALMAGAFIALSGVQLLGAGAKEIDAFPTFDSYIKVTGQAASVTGSGASFARRTQQPENGSGGIEEFFYTKDLEGDRTLVMEGRALAGVEDYLGKLTLSKSEFGSFEMGYKSFRTFYDGIGGFFPVSGYWNPLIPQELHVDRGEFWVAAKLALPDKPEFEVRYSNSTRTGKKDSTVWGRSDFTGLANTNVPISPARGMYPGFRRLDEQHERLEGIMKGNVGNTSYHVEVYTDSTDDHNSINLISYPGELRRFPAPPSTTLLPPQNVNNQSTTTEQSGMETETWAAIGTAETEFSDKAKLIMGLSYQTLDADITGDRKLVTDTPTAVGMIQDIDNNFANLKGTSTVDITTGRLGFEFKPNNDLTMRLVVKGEDKQTKNTVAYTNVSSTVNTTTGAITTTQTPTVGYSNFEDTSWTPDFDIRYSGIANIALYGNATFKMGDGDERLASPYTTATPSTDGQAIQNVEEDRAKYTVGANWRQSATLSLRGELFYKDDTNHVMGYDIRIGDNYQLDRKFAGVKLTGVVKPLAQLTSTTRYIYQKGESQVTGYLPNFPAYDALNMEVHSINETIDWTPNQQFYMQANLTMVFNMMGTVYPRAGTTPATSSAPAWNTNGVLQNTNNNYFTGSIMAGAALTKADNLQVQLYYYKADNYDPQLAAYTMPYGASATDVALTVGLDHKFSDRMIGSFKVGYFDSENPTTGGNTDFHGPMASISLNFAL